MNVKVVFPKNYMPDIAKAIVAERICRASFLYINLPDYIEVHFVNLKHNVYGETILKPGINHKINVNLTLPINEIIYPITHELIHISQIYEGKLGIARNGSYVWENKTYKIDTNKIRYKDYMQLPWEYDVTVRQKTLIEQIIG